MVHSTLWTSPFSQVHILDSLIPGPGSWIWQDDDFSPCSSFVNPSTDYFVLANQLGGELVEKIMASIL
jgi:hypothetical protein